MSEALLINPTETARLLGISRAGLWRLISSGRFGPAVIHLGRLARVRRDELTAWIEASCPARCRWQWPGEGGRP